MPKGVMVVEDEDEVRDEITRYFIKLGLDAVAAPGGKQCLELFKKGFKGVVLMDVHMPDMNGWDTIREIIGQGYRESAVIVLLTADESARSDKMTELRQYVAEYIPKPVDLKQLVTAVKYYLRYF